MEGPHPTVPSVKVDDALYSIINFDLNSIQKLKIVNFNKKS